ncbi:hypothetical protein ACFOD4_16995 [Pseudoroseomonas globiformis]|uniref:Glycosyltransferase RgtA/B/C/D-like domain-containing protein n=1 Tax=Teichococcus globiformis TaxID=2307229 RepID=A0ABV7G239_9PROT
MKPSTMNAAAGEHAPERTTPGRHADPAYFADTWAFQALALRILALLPALGFLLVVLSPPLNHDVAAVLDFAARMLRGEPLYAELVDVNPPLVFLLNLPAAWLAAMTPLSDIQALLGLLLLFCAGTLWLCLRLAQRGAAERAVLMALLPLLMLQAGYDFGQREHLMAVAALPYLFLAERRIAAVATPWPLWLAALGLAALGFALKPHFLAVPLLVEAMVLLAVWRGRGLVAAFHDPAPWLMAALWALYVAAIPVFFPAYFDEILPLVWGWYVDLGSAPWWRVLLTAPTGSAALLALGAALLAGFAPSRLGWLPKLAAAAMLGGLAAALVQHKGWSYHLVPVWLFGGLAAATLAARAADAALSPGTARRAGPFLAFGLALFLGAFALRGDQSPWLQLNWAESRGGQLAAWLAREAPEGRLLVLSPDIPDVYPAVNYAGERLLLPFMSTWLLQATYGECSPGAPRYRAPRAMPEAERRVWNSVAEALAQGAPATVMIARWSGIPECGGHFDLLDYFLRNPEFARAWRMYRPAGEIGGYRLFRRVP